MKKCPKCGTMLDDSKKKCYMCGAALGQEQNTSLGDVFNVDMGTTVSSSEPSFGFSNEFSNKSNDFNDEFMNDDNSSENNNVGFSVPVVPVLTNNQEKEKQKKIKVKEPAKKEKKPKIKKEKQKKSPKQEVVNSEPNPQTFFDNISNGNSEPIIPEVENSKPPINWGTNMKEDIPKPVKKRKININSDLPSFLTPSFMFNSICFVVTVILLIVGYNLYVKKSPEQVNGTVNLGELKFNVDSSFNLESEDAISKYYTRGGTCAVKVSTGDAKDGFIDSYFDQIKNSYLSSGNYNTQKETYKINGNVWSSLSIIELVQNNASDSGFSTVSKYKYITIVYNKKYYSVVYFNDNGDSTCASAYEKLVDSLDFAKE